MTKREVIAYFLGMRDCHIKMARRKGGKWVKHHVDLARVYNRDAMLLRTGRMTLAQLEGSR